MLKVTGDITVVATFSASTNPPPPGAPLAPTGLAAAPVSPTEIDLAWFKPAGTVAVDHYVIYRGQKPVGSVAAPDTKYKDTSLAASTRYVYSVVAVAADQKASPSSSSTAATTPPSAPKLLTPTVVKGEADLEWIPTFPNPDGRYIVSRDDGVKVWTLPGTQTTLSDGHLDTSMGHTYTVQAIDVFGASSPPSNQVTSGTVG